MFICSLNPTLSCLKNIFENAKSAPPPLFSLLAQIPMLENGINQWLTLLAYWQKGNVSEAIEQFQICFEDLGFNILSEIAQPTLALILEYYPDFLSQIGQELNPQAEKNFENKYWLLGWFYYWYDTQLFAQFLNVLPSSTFFNSLAYAYFSCLLAFSQRKYQIALQKLENLGDFPFSIAQDALRAALNFELKSSDNVSLLERYTQLYPQCASFYYLLALTLSETQNADPQKINFYFSQTTTLAPFFAEAYANWAVYLYENKQYYEALELCNQSIALAPNQADLFFNRGMVLCALQKPLTAWADFQEAQRLGFAIPQDTLADIVNSLLEAKEIDAARSAGAFLFETNSLSNFELVLRSRIYFALEQYENALKDLQCLLANCPNEPRLLWEIATTLRQLGRPKQALDYLIRIPSTASEYIKSRFLITACYLELQDYDNAQNFLPIEPQALEYWLLQTQIYEAQNMPHRALTFINNALDIIQAPNLFLTKARLLLAQEKLQEAQETLLLSLNQFPDNEDLLLLLAQIELETGNLEQAKKRLSLVLEKNNRSQIALHLLALTLASQGEYESAYTYYTRLVELSVPDPEIFANRANLAEILGYYTEALADLDRAIELAPDEDEFYMRKAEIYKILRNWEKQEAELKKVEELRNKVLE
jgi:tetratricopeptide (TPR) repeat protein